MRCNTYHIIWYIIYNYSYNYWDHTFWTKKFCIFIIFPQALYPILPKYITTFHEKYKWNIYPFWSKDWLYMYTSSPAIVSHLFICRSPLEFFSALKRKKWMVILVSLAYISILSLDPTHPSFSPWSLHTISNCCQSRSTWGNRTLLSSIAHLNLYSVICKYDSMT